MLFCIHSFILVINKDEIRGNLAVSSTTNPYFKMELPQNATGFHVAAQGGYRPSLFVDAYPRRHQFELKRSQFSVSGTPTEITFYQGEVSHTTDGMSLEETDFHDLYVRMSAWNEENQRAQMTFSFLYD